MWTFRRDVTLTTLLQRFPEDYFAADVDSSKCLHYTSSNALFWTHYVGRLNVIYYKFSHGDISYRLNGKNVNVMLEFVKYSTIAHMSRIDRAFS